MISSPKTIVYIISAPSGSGKSTLVNEVLKLVPNLDFSISYTTRPSRGSEQNGKQYHFVVREEFEAMVQAGEFLEHAEFDGNCYGTARRYLREAQQKGTDLLLDIDVQGAAQIQQKLPDAVSIFVCLPTRRSWSGVCAIAARMTNRTSGVASRPPVARLKNMIATTTS